MTGTAEPPVQQELRSPGEAAGTGHRACRIPKGSAGAWLSHRAALALLSPGNSMEHRTSGSLLSSPLAFPALRALPPLLHPLCPVALLSLLPKQTWRGHAAFLPHCACSWLFCCSFRICPRLFPHCGGRTASLGERQSPVVLGLGTLWGRCPCLGSVLGWGGQCCVAQLEARMCWDEERAEGRAAGDAQPKACHPALPLPVPSRHLPHGAKLPFDCALFLLHFSFFPSF